MSFSQLRNWSAPLSVNFSILLSNLLSIQVTSVQFVEKKWLPIEETRKIHRQASEGIKKVFEIKSIPLEKINSTSSIPLTKIKTYEVNYEFLEWIVNFKSKSTRWNESYRRNHRTNYEKQYLVKAFNCLFLEHLHSSSNSIRFYLLLTMLSMANCEKAGVVERSWKQ